VFPGPGGFAVDAMRHHAAVGAVHERRALAIKGNNNEVWGGRALFALAAVHRCADLLRDYEIVVYSATPVVEAVVDHMVRTSGLRIACLPPSSYDEIVRLLGRSRVALAISKSDGTPNAMLEAMIMGAFPVQSDTVSTGEWIRDGENGLLVPPEDVDAIERALRRAMQDDALVDSAAPINLEMARERLDASVVRPAVLAMYERVAAETMAKRGVASNRTGTS
jgi:glycosyltransferase involved in cell wall biosynthesis